MVLILADVLFSGVALKVLPLGSVPANFKLPFPLKFERIPFLHIILLLPFQFLDIGRREGFLVLLNRLLLFCLYLEFLFYLMDLLILKGEKFVYLANKRVTSFA